MLYSIDVCTGMYACIVGHETGSRNSLCTERDSDLNGYLHILDNAQLGYITAGFPAAILDFRNVSNMVWRRHFVANSCSGKVAKAHLIAVADLVDPPCVPCYKHRLQIKNGARWHMVTMELYWEVDIGLSESAKKSTLGDLEEVISRSRKWKLPVSSKRLLLYWSRVPMNKNVHRCPFNKSASCLLTFDLDWPLGVISRSRMWKSPISSWWREISIWLLWNTIGKLVLNFQNPQKKFDFGWPWRGHFKVAKVKIARIV